MDIPNMLKQLEKCSIATGWIFQIVIWILFTVSAIFNCTVTFILFSIIYSFYFFIELFTSPFTQYIHHKYSPEEINQKINKLFQTSPRITFKCIDKKDNNNTCLSRKLFRYRFSKDISSPFVLNLQDINLNKKNYIKFSISEEIEFADSETAHEYEIQKSAFTREIERKFRNAKFEIVESKKIPRFNLFILITIKNKEPKCINLCILFIFVCLTLGELYKLYFDSFCSYQSFIIKKIVSTHPYLNQNDFEQNYENKLLQYKKDELKPKQERNLEISYQTGYSVIKGIVKVIKDKKQIISHDINKLNIDKQINIEIINEIKEQKNNSDFNNEYNNNNK